MLLLLAACQFQLQLAGTHSLVLKQHCPCSCTAFYTIHQELEFISKLYVDEGVLIIMALLRHKKLIEYKLPSLPRWSNFAMR